MRGKGLEYPLHLDWLGISLALHEYPKRCPPNHQWAKMSCTNVWECRWVLYSDRGDRVFTLLFKPRSSIIKANAALLEVENEWFYHGIGLDGIFGLLGFCVGFSVLGVSRADFALDFVPNGEQRNIIEALADGSVYVGGKRCGSGFWSLNQDEWMPRYWRGRRIPHCISWGHKTSAVKWKLYYKSKELKDAVGGVGWDKPYIVDTWNLAGMDERDVWRLEVSVRGCNQQEVAGVPMSLDYVCNYKGEIFKALYESRFVCRKAEGHVDRTNDERVYLLHLEKAWLSVKCRQSDGLAEHNGRLTLLRHLVKSVEEPAVLYDAATREGVFNHIRQIVRRDGLRRYFQAMVGCELDEWCKQVVESAGGEEVKDYERDVVLAPNYHFDDMVGTQLSEDELRVKRMEDWLEDREEVAKPAPNQLKLF